MEVEETTKWKAMGRTYTLKSRARRRFLGTGTRASGSRG